MKMTTYKIKDICDVINGRAYFAICSNFATALLVIKSNFASFKFSTLSAMPLKFFNSKFCAISEIALIFFVVLSIPVT